MAGQGEQHPAPFPALMAGQGKQRPAPFPALSCVGPLQLAAPKWSFCNNTIILYYSTGAFMYLTHILIQINYIIMLAYSCHSNTSTRARTHARTHERTHATVIIILHFIIIINIFCFTMYLVRKVLPAVIMKEMSPDAVLTLAKLPLKATTAFFN